MNAETGKDRGHIEAIKKQMTHMGKTASDREAIFLVWVMDRSVDRGDIMIALKELGLNDCFEYEGRAA